MVENNEDMVTKKKRQHDNNNSMDVDNNGDDDDGHADDNGDNSDKNKPLPFSRLNIYGEHKRAVSAVSFAPGRTTKNLGRPLCASASADGCVKIWDLTKKGDDDEINNNTPSSVPSGNIEGTGNSGVPPTDGDSQSPIPSTTISSNKPHEPSNQDVVMSGDANNNSSDTFSYPYKPIRDVGEMLVPVQTLVGHSRGINDVAWSNTGNGSNMHTHYVATASDDKTLRLWDATTSDALVEFRGHSNFVFCCKFNPQSSNLLVSGSFDETVKLWDVRTGDCVSTLPAHSDPVTAVDFNRDGTCIVSGSHDGLIRIWDTATGECLKTIYAHGNPPVSHVQYSPNGKYVLAGTLDSKLRLWHMTSKVYDNNIKSSNSSKMTTATGGSGGKCTKTYSCTDGTINHINTKYCIVSDFVVSDPFKQRQSIITGSETGKLILYDINTRKIQQILNSHTDSVLAVSSHDKEELLVSGGMTNDRTVQFWQPNGGVGHYVPNLSKLALSSNSTAKHLSKKHKQ